MKTISLRPNLRVAATEGENPGIGWSDIISGPRFEDKFRSANQMEGISKAGGDKMADS